MQCLNDYSWLQSSLASSIGSQMQRLKDSVFVHNSFPDNFLQIFPNKMWRWQFGETEYLQMVDIVKENRPVELPLVLFRDEPKTNQAVSAFITNRALYKLDSGNTNRVELGQITDISFQNSLTNPTIYINHDISIPVKHINRNQLIDLAQFFGQVIQVILGNTASPTTVKGIPDHLTSAHSARFCAECGEPLEPDDKFCSSCGAAVTKYCLECGAKNEIDAAFCMECGAKL